MSNNSISRGNDQLELSFIPLPVMVEAAPLFKVRCVPFQHYIDRRLKQQLRDVFN